MAKSPKKNVFFRCAVCGAENPPAAKTSRNHCRKCLFSMHLDGEIPGDRKSHCGGKMRPIAVLTRHRKADFVIVHRCEKCGERRQNRAADDDDFEKLLEIARQQIFG